MIFKFEKFYKADEGVAYAVDADGHAFRLGPGMRVEHVAALPDGLKEVSAEEWASDHLPISFEIHLAGEETQERELTAEEKAMDEKYRLDLRDWLKRRNTFIGEALKSSFAPAVEITETTTREYGSPLLVDALAAIVGYGVQEPEDPIEWRRAARKGQLADIIREQIPGIMAAIGQVANAKVQANGTRTSAPPAEPRPKPPATGKPIQAAGSYLEHLVASGVVKSNGDGTYTVPPDVIERIVENVRAHVGQPPATPQAAPRPSPETPPAEKAAEPPKP